jgi:hypothetical protein
MKRMWPYVFVAAGICVLIYGVGLIRDARNCARWPSIEGRIVRSEAQVVGRERKQPTYSPDVMFTYLVDGKTYESSRITLVPRNYSSLTSVQSVLGRYPVGATVQVFHDPADPSNCVLVNVPTGTEWAYAIGGAAFIGVGLFMFRSDGS